MLKVDGGLFRNGGADRYTLKGYVNRVGGGGILLAQDPGAGLIGIGTSARHRLRPGGEGSEDGGGQNCGDRL